MEQLTPFVVLSGLIFIPFEVIGYISKSIYIVHFSKLPIQKNIKYTRYFVLIDSIVISSYILGFIHVFDFENKTLGIFFLLFVYIGNLAGMFVGYKLWKSKRRIERFGNEENEEETDVSFLMDHFFDLSALFFEIIMFLHLILWCRSSLVIGMKILSRIISIFWTHLSLIRSSNYSQL